MSETRPGEPLQDPNVIVPKTLRGRLSEISTSFNNSETAINLLIIGATATLATVLYTIGGNGHMSGALTMPTESGANPTDIMAANVMLGAGAAETTATMMRPLHFRQTRLNESWETFGSWVMLNFAANSGTAYAEPVISFGVGTLARVGLHAAAKALYDTGWTKGIYKKLGINDPRTASAPTNTAE